MQSIRTYALHLLITIGITACGHMQPPEAPKTSAEVMLDTHASLEQSLRMASDQWYAALNAMYTGEVEPMSAIWSHGADATYMSAGEQRLDGWEPISAAFQKTAGIKPGGRINCNATTVHAGNDMGYSICTEELLRAGNETPVNRRATNIFRMENGQWKLVHYHSELLQQAPKNEQEAK